MGYSNEMHTERKLRCFIMTVAHLLRYGFALTAKSAANLHTTQVQPLLDSLSPRCTDIAEGEQHCYDLLNANVVDCFALYDDNDDVEMVKATVPRFALTLFGCEVSPITLHVYVEHLVTRLHCSEEAILMAVVYIARAVKKGIPFTPRSAHRMIAVALVVAIKMHDEKQYSMNYYAKVTGIPHAKLVKAEAAMLQVLEFTTFVTPAEYVLTLFSLRSCHSQTTEPLIFGEWGHVTRRIGIPLLSQNAGNPSAKTVSPSSPSVIVRGSVRSVQVMRKGSNWCPPMDALDRSTEGAPPLSSSDAMSSSTTSSLLVWFAPQ